jgi:hypothetical protein
VTPLPTSTPLNISICTPEITLTNPKLVDGYLIQSDAHIVYKMRVYPLPDLTLPLRFESVSAFTLDVANTLLSVLIAGDTRSTHHIY